MNITGKIFSFLLYFTNTVLTKEEVINKLQFILYRFGIHTRSYNIEINDDPSCGYRIILHFTYRGWTKFKHSTGINQVLQFNNFEAHLYRILYDSDIKLPQAFIDTICYNHPAIFIKKYKNINRNNKIYNRLLINQAEYNAMVILPECIKYKGNLEVWLKDKIRLWNTIGTKIENKLSELKEE